MSPAVKFAAISDVHSNLEALGAVLRDIEARGLSAVHFIGDAVGYGPEPNECVELIVNRCSSLVMGNHDAAAAGVTSAERFNPYARTAVQWAASVLSEGMKTAIKGFPYTMKLSDDDVLLVHATPREPEDWAYLISRLDAKINFGYFGEGICMLGHSHRPVIFELESSGGINEDRRRMEFREGCRYIVNIGSVGQPRDGDPRACYAVVDDKGVELVRVAYDIGSVQGKMRAAGLPEMLAERLTHGR